MIAPYLEQKKTTKFREKTSSYLDSMTKNTLELFVSIISVMVER